MIGALWKVTAARPSETRNPLENLENLWYPARAGLGFAGSRPMFWIWVGIGVLAGALVVVALVSMLDTVDPVPHRKDPPS